MWLVFGLQYVAGLVSPSTLHVFSYYLIELVFLPVTVAALLFAARRAGPSELGAFFASLALAHGVWLVAAIARWPLQASLGLDTERVIRDGIYCFYYLAYLWSLELARSGRNGSSLERFTNLVGSVVLVGGSLVYLQILPGATSSATYVLYALLDIYVAVRLGAFALRAWGTRIFPIFGLLFLSAGALALSDSLQAAYDRGLLEYSETSLLNSLWLLSYVPLILATRVRLPGGSDLDRDFALARRRLEAVSKLWSPLIAYAFALPAAHIALYASGLGDRDSEVARAYFVVAWLIAATVLIAVEHKTIARRLGASDLSLRSSLERVRGMSAAKESAAEFERKRVARELHDELSQLLTALQFDVAWLRSHGTGNPETVRRLAAADEVVSQALQFSMRVATDLRPRVLDDLGLASAIESLAREAGIRSGFDVCFTEIGVESLPRPEVDSALYRIAQESLTNSLKHSEASRIEIDLVRGAAAIQLTIRDDGCGLAGQVAFESKGLGLVGIRERAAELGGELRLEGGIGGAGLAVVASIPARRSGDTFAASPENAASPALGHARERRSDAGTPRREL